MKTKVDREAWLKPAIGERAMNQLPVADDHIARRAHNRNGVSQPLAAARNTLASYEDATIPPSHEIVSPTVNEPARELRNIASPAISSAVPTRPRGLPRPILSQSTPSVSPPKPTPVLSIQVGKGPGAMAFRRIPRRAHSTASDRVIATTPALAQAEGSTNAEPVQA